MAKATTGAASSGKLPSRTKHRKLLKESKVSPQYLPKLELHPISRYWTFVAGVIFTLLMYLLTEGTLGHWIENGINPRHRPGWVRWVIFSLSVLFFFFGGFEKGRVAGRKSKEEIENDPAEHPDPEITSGFQGVILAFDAPLPASLGIVLPSGDNWLPPFVRQESIDVRENGWNMPPTPPPAGEEEGFEIESISGSELHQLHIEGKKYVPMETKVRIRFRVVNAIKWQRQNKKAIEKTIVDFISQSIRHIAANGDYPVEGREERLKVTSDFHLMQQKDELGRALTEDVRALVEKDWGIAVVGVVIHRLRPKDKKLIEQYEQVAIEIAQRTAQTVEGKLIRANARRLALAGVDPKEALMYAAVASGIGSLEVFKGIGNAAAFLGVPQPAPKPTT